MKRLFLLLLVFAKIILFADGIEPIGSGTETDPYQIANFDNLLWISTNQESWDKYFIQTTNINAGETQDLNNGEGFLPIGVDSLNFTGNYNGGNYIIDSLYINRENLSHQALFGYLQFASLTNITLTNVAIVGNNYVAGIAGYCYDSDISNCNVSGNVQGTDHTAGLIGECDFFSTVDSCYNSARINGHYQVGGIAGSIQRSSNICYSHNEEKVTGHTSVGGISGYSYNSSILNCYNNSRINNISSYIGGIIGELYFSTASDCYNNGNIIGGFSVGGIAGYCYDNGVVTKCYNTGNIDCGRGGGLIGDTENAYSISKSYNIGNLDGAVVGGLIGRNTNTNVANCYSRGNVNGDEQIAGFIASNDSNSSIYNCYSTGNVNPDSYASGFIFSNPNSGICNCFWDIETSGQATSDGGTGKTTEEMKNVSTYTSTSTEGLDTPWDFINNPFDDNANENIWDINSEINDGYPFLTTTPVVEAENTTINDLSELPELKGNYPNPFNPETTISFSVPKESNVKISVYNLKGQKVKTVAKGKYEKGIHKIVWDGSNSNKQTVSSGVYFYQLIVNGKVEAVKKCLMLK